LVVDAIRVVRVHSARTPTHERGDSFVVHPLESLTGENATMVICPECAHDVAVAKAPRLSEIVECSDCHSELEVITLEPLVLALAPEVQEDWGE
jgi:alpha-aminoadipate carrier protein LysW